MDGERGERDYTARAKVSWIYICRAIIARKYIVASATMVRMTADILSVPILRHANQATTRNADSSECFSTIRNLRERSEQKQSLTKRGGDHIRGRLELEVDIDWAQIESVDRESRVVKKRHRPEERRCKRQD